MKKQLTLNGVPKQSYELALEIAMRVSRARSEDEQTKILFSFFDAMAEVPPPAVQAAFKPKRDEIEARTVRAIRNLPPESLPVWAEDVGLLLQEVDRLNAATTAACDAIEAWLRLPPEKTADAAGLLTNLKERLQ